MPSSEIATDVKKVLDEFAVATIAPLEKAGSGANSSVYRVTTEAGYLALKFFPVREGDKRNRIKTEWDALTFMHQCGVENVPEPIAHSARHNAMLLGWIDGTPVSTPTRNDLDKALGFVADIFQISEMASPGQFDRASEACLSAGEIVRQIKARVEALNSLPEMDRFLSEDFLPTLDQAIELNTADIAKATELPIELQRLIKRVEYG